MASMQCYKEEGKEFGYFEKSSGTYKKPTNYSNSGYQQTYYDEERCYETNRGMTDYGTGQQCYHKEMCYSTNPKMMVYDLSHGHQPELSNKYEITHPCRPMMVYGSDHGKMGYGFGHSTHGMRGYGTGHNTHMQKPGFSGMGLGAWGHAVGFGKKHEGHHGHGGYGMGAAFGYTTIYKKQHRRGKGGYGSGSGSGSSDDEYTTNK